MMVPRDDFDVILGVDFFVNALVYLIFYHGGIVISNGLCLSYVECILAWKKHFESSIR